MIPALTCIAIAGLLVMAYQLWLMDREHTARWREWERQLVEEQALRDAQRRLSPK